MSPFFNCRVRNVLHNDNKSSSFSTLSVLQMISTASRPSISAIWGTISFHALITSTIMVISLILTLLVMLFISYFFLEVFIQWGLVKAGQVGLMEVQMLSSFMIFQTAFSQSHGLRYPFTGLHIPNTQLQKYWQFWTQVVLNCAKKNYTLRGYFHCDCK